MLYGEHNSINLLGKCFIGNAGEGVLLVNCCFYAHLSRRSYDGTADVTAEADYGIGCKFTYYLFRLRAGLENKSDRSDVLYKILRCELSLKTRNLDSPEVKSRIGYEL